MDFLGQPMMFWVELKRRVDEGHEFGYESLLNEIIALRGKVAFYEERIRQMAHHADLLRK